MANTDWKIPADLQPDPGDHGFDLDRALQAVVGLSVTVPANAFTASVLGTERAGSGVVIREDGLVLTIGYLITEAESIWLATGDGRVVPGHALAYDQETGFGVVQALGRLNLPALALRDDVEVEHGEPAILAAGGGRSHAIETKVIRRQEFAGYWEYLLDEALFTAPAHPFWSGGALIDEAGKLIGIGSLVLQTVDSRGRQLVSNMVVPVRLLTPILGDMLSTGRANRTPRPWLGIYAAEQGDAVIVAGVAKGGPAEHAGIQTGDQVLAVGGAEVGDLASLWRTVWATGPAGAVVPLKVARGDETVTVAVQSADRNRLLRSPQLH